MEYRWDSTAGCLMRFDAEKWIFEGFDWEKRKWEHYDEAYNAYVGIYDGFLDKITEKDVNDIIKRDLKK
jgi:hypothetical protein